MGLRRKLRQVLSELFAIAIVEVRSEVSVDRHNPGAKLLKERLHAPVGHAPRRQIFLNPRGEGLVVAQLTFNAERIPFNLILDAKHIKERADVLSKAQIRLVGFGELNRIRQPPMAHFVRERRNVGVRCESDCVLLG